MAEGAQHIRTMHNAHPIYRPDIDGLRAIAILSVVIYHAFPTKLRGGFVGVDIFFVISGYLISSIIFRSLQRGDFSFSEFYARRVKRIFPALILVLGASYTIGWFVLLPDEFKQLGKHMAAGAGFVLNIVLNKEAGYFDTASELKPLMHLWSLSIEEQFYLIFPVLIWGAWRLGLNALSVVLVLVLLSFGLNLGGIEKDVTKVFFMPQTRFWELLAGSVLAYVQLFKAAPLAYWLQRGVFHPLVFRHPPAAERRDAILSNLLAFGGLLLIVAADFGLHKGKLYPGGWALFPVLGACLLILAGSGAWVNRKILANRWMVFIGLISYPLYLWHWPLLSFARIMEGETPSRNIRMAVVALSLVLAWLTYRLIERPLRFGSKTWVKTAALCLLLALVGYVGYNAFERNGLGFRVKDRQDFAEFFENNPPTLNYSKHNNIFEKYRQECNFYDLENWMEGHPTTVPRPSIDKSCYTATSNTSIFLWGDSHAEQLYYGLKTRLPEDISILQVASSGCAAQIGDKNNAEPEYCRKSNIFALDEIKKHIPQIVILAQHSAHDQRNDLQAITSLLKSIGVAKVIVIGPVPRWEPFLWKLIVKKFWLLTPRRTYQNTIPEVFITDRSLKEKYKNIAAGVQYISMVDFFCNPEGCLTYLGEDKRDGLVTFDYGHLTPNTSVYVAEKLIVPEILKILQRD